MTDASTRTPGILAAAEVNFCLHDIAHAFLVSYPARKSTTALYGCPYLGNVFALGPTATKIAGVAVGFLPRIDLPREESRLVERPTVPESGEQLLGFYFGNRSLGELVCLINVDAINMSAISDTINRT